MQADNLAHLAAFAAVARHHSFRKASAELALSPSAVSYAIRSLEERLGVNLFNRTTRSVSLTAAGQRLLERIQPALRDVGHALDEMNAFRSTPTGTLRINTSRASAYLLVAPLVPRFLAAYPDIRLEIVDDDSFVDIVAEGYDVGIRFQEAVPEDMVAVPIAKAQRFALVGSPAYFARHAIPRHPTDLLGHDCVRHRFPSGRIYKWEFERDGAKLEIDPPGRVTLGDLHLMTRMALDGVGLTLQLEEHVRDLVESGRLLRSMEDWCPPFPGFMLYYPRQQRMSSALRAFIDMVRET
ncbi:MAG TPA: LysR family transcriptional regulator [Bordetella sp.]